jgi:hypothetical protein
VISHRQHAVRVGPWQRVAGHFTKVQLTQRRAHGQTASGEVPENGNTSKPLWIIGGEDDVES